MVSFLFPPSLLPSLPLQGTNACCDIDCRPLYPNMHLSSRAPSRERRGSCYRIVCSTLIQLLYSPGWTLDTRAMYHQLLELYSSQSLHLQERKNRCWSTNRENKKKCKLLFTFSKMVSLIQYQTWASMERAIFTCLPQKGQRKKNTLPLSLQSSPPPSRYLFCVDTVAMDEAPWIISHSKPNTNNIMSKWSVFSEMLTEGQILVRSPGKTPRCFLKQFPGDI